MQSQSESGIMLKDLSTSRGSQATVKYKINF